jgi:hypothetical protein
MVTQIGPTPHERDHPSPGLPVQDEYDRGLPSAVPELTPVVDRPEHLFEALEKLLDHGG